jgi:hypothetical protein
VNKIDLTKDLKPLYSPRKGMFVVVDVPKLDFLMIDGEGDPNTASSYSEAVEALYSVAYTAKFLLKLGAAKVDFRVMPLEGLWWSDDMEAFTAAGRRDRWKWTMMMAVPKAVTASVLKEASGKAAAKKPLPGLSRIKLKSFTEGRAAQTMYLGAYRDEGPTIAAMHQFIVDSGHKLSGKHHEIYLSDPRRTAPAKLKTILRQPFA